MNENMQNALAEIIRNSMTALESAKNFLVAEIPDVIHQLLLWKFTTSLIAFTASIIFGLVIPIIVGVVAFKRERQFKDTYSEGMAYTIGIFASLLSLFIAFLLFNLTWLQIWIAPKIFLIEYAAKLIK